MKNEKIEIANRIKNNVDFEQFRHCNAYISNYVYEEESKTYYRLIKSYNTIAALVDCDNYILYEFGKYSTTTSKQITQIHNAYFSDCKRVLINETNW